MRCTGKARLRVSVRAKIRAKNRVGIGTGIRVVFDMPHKGGGAPWLVRVTSMVR